MPTVTVAPTGLVFSRMRNASSPTYQANRYKIKSGYATKIAMGDLVSTGGPAANQGYVIASPNNPANILGVFAGVIGYYDTNFQQTVFGLNGSWPGAGAAPQNDVDCLVVDDPQAVFRVQVQNGTWAPNWRGQNIGFAANTNSLPNAAGISQLVLDGTTVSQNAALPFRIMEIAMQPGGIGAGAGLGLSDGGGASDPTIVNPWIEVCLNFAINEQQQAAGL